LRVKYWQLLATERTINLPAFLIVGLIAVLGTFVAQPVATFTDRLAWVPWAALSLLPALTIYLVANRLISRPERWQISVIVIAVIVAWMTRGIVLAIVPSLTGLEDAVTPLSRVVSATISISCWAFLVGAVLEARHQYSLALRSKIATAFMLDSVLQELNKTTESQLSEQLERLDAQMILVQNQAVSGEGSVGDRVRNAVESQIRPAAHFHWLTSQSTQRRKELFATYFTRLKNQEISFMLVTIVFCVGLAIATWTRHGFATAMIFTSLCFLGLTATWAALSLFTASLSRFHLYRHALYLLFGAAIVATTCYLWNEFRGYGDLDWTVVVSLVIALWVDIFLVLIVTATFSLLSERIDNVNFLGDDIQAAISHEILRRSSQSIASKLHNEIQPRLVAAYLKAEKSHDVSIVMAELDQVRELIASELGPTSRAQPSILENFQTRVDAWSGLATMQLNIDADLEAHGRYWSHLCNLGLELIANSVRHGDATHIVMSLWAGEHTLFLSAEDNGEWKESSKGGIGLAMSLADGIRQTREQTVMGTKVTLIWQLST